MTWVSDILLMRIVAKDVQGIVRYMTVNCLQLKTGVGIIVYMDNKVKSKNSWFSWCWMFEFWFCGCQTLYSTLRIKAEVFPQV